MAHELPRLRLGLDFFPSQDPERPGLVIRDPYRFSDAMLLAPPPIVAALDCFDGEKTELDLRDALVRSTGEIQVGDIERELVEALSAAGFLEDETFARMRDGKMSEFAAAPVREASHAGSAYPEDEPAAREELAGYLAGAAPAPEEKPIGIAAPHVSPFGGWQTYREAYGALDGAGADKVFVVLGTSHYGEPDRFGLTRKPYRTPLGEARCETELAGELEAKAGEAVRMEDYCHAIEHSIEFQVLFLQHLYGPAIRVLPVLCGAFGQSLYGGGLPEDVARVERFLGVLGEMAAREGDRLFWVLGIDMAHMGARYGDRFAARAGEGPMRNVELRDRARIESVAAGDARGFWEQVRENQDDLKWCGSSPLYTFLKAVPGARATLRRYEQWNIDERSVVSFAALAFH